MQITAPAEPAAFARNAAIMGPLIARFDWAATPLGPMARWPAHLKSYVAMILESPLPMALFWGRDGILIYNDGIAAFDGNRHPYGLGQPVMEGWPELASLSSQALAIVFAGGNLSLREELLSLERHGHNQDMWADVDFSPLPDEDGLPAGVLAIIREITEHVLSDWRRREAENQLASAIEATQLGTWERDLRSGASIWSDACKAMLGIASETQISSADFEKALHKADKDAILAALKRAIDPLLREPYNVEYRVTGVDGVTRWVAARGKTVFDEAGQPRRIYGTTLDITARKNAELRQSYLVELGDRLRGLETTAEIAQAAAEILGKALDCSRAGYAIVVNGDHTLVESDWTDGQAVSLAGPRKFGSLNPGFLIPMQAGETLIVDNAATDPRTAPDQAAWREIGVQALLNSPLLENGELAAILYVHNPAPRRWRQDEITLLDDIADRTWEASCRAKAAQALRKLNETLELEVAYRTAQRDRIWKLSSDVMLVASFEAVIESVNPAWKAMFGWSETDLVGRNFISLTHPDDREATRAEVHRLASGQPTIHFQNRYRRRDGSYLWLSWRAVPDTNAIHAIGRDITAEREQAEALQAAEDSLRQAQKMEVVGQLTGGIAHDFNNLLQGIAGSLDLLDKRLTQRRFDELEKFVSAARVSTSRAAALTHRLLAFSRRQPLDPKPVQANPLVLAMEELLRRTMGEQIEISLILADDLWLTLCDPNQLESAILNLAINARDAMPDGGRLTLQTSNTEIDARYAARSKDMQPGNFICLSVTDTGTGMPQSVIDQAFEPFYTTKPLGQGTGLGLSMIYGFIKQSGGQAKIHSQPGKGTTVKLFLPRCEDAICEIGSPATDTQALTVAGETVLVVEDETIVRGLVVEVLDELGYQVLEAADGPAGLQILQSSQVVDLLITDIGLPGLNGRQIADAARLLRPALKILFMTGYAENAAAPNGFLEPGMAMITKPFAIDVLTTRIQNLLS